MLKVEEGIPVKYTEHEGLRRSLFSDRARNMEAER
jgi:hypothetical protein